MNSHDKSNLEFLLNVSPEVFQNWLSQTDLDDIDYALELLNAARAELLVKECEMFDEVVDVSEAVHLLKVFQ